MRFDGAKSLKIVFALPLDKSMVKIFFGNRM